ncbi:MAG: amidohydrolase family protein [Patescibacteria group bacterium]|nr:amidohydrolase family protein [Patescibacteria group bacterium]MDE2172379.1 amidohydrolase family protein [Patescibacteria group bacterium]
MNKKTLSIAGTIVNHDSSFTGTVIIDRDSGLISEIGGYSGTADIVPPNRCFILPGLIDVHVHGRQDATDEESYKEDFISLGNAGVNGGVVFVCSMGNTPKPPVDDATYDELAALAAASPIPVLLYAMIGPDTNPLFRSVPYKLCHARTTGKNDKIFFPTRLSIYKAAFRYRGHHVSNHCENLEILKECGHEEAHEARRPAHAETTSIDDALELIEYVFGFGKICHCSVPTGIEKIRAAKRRGVRVTCEVTPHHLYFDTSMITPENRHWLQMNPPLRSPEDRLAMIEHLRLGDIDMLASDHAPHTAEDKRKGASGQPHLDTFGPFTTWLIEKRYFAMSQIVRMASYNPAQFVNAFLPKEHIGLGYGRIGVGHVGSLTVIDMTTPVTVTKDMLKTKCGWSPFEGITFPGSVRHTIVRGHVLK